jgi:hypothetical protein
MATEMEPVAGSLYHDAWHKQHLSVLELVLTFIEKCSRSDEVITAFAAEPSPCALSRHKWWHKPDHCKDHLEHPKGSSALHITTLRHTQATHLFTREAQACATTCAISPAEALGRGRRVS